jgi:hypothetical protein
LPSSISDKCRDFFCPPPYPCKLINFPPKKLWNSEKLKNIHIFLLAILAVPQAANINSSPKINAPSSSSEPALRGTEKGGMPVEMQTGIPGWTRAPGPSSAH